MGDSTIQPTSWRDLAIDLQQSFLEIFGGCDWDAFEHTERHWLEKRVGYALYGPPETIPSDGDDNKSGYTVRQLDNIREVSDAIIRTDIHGQKHDGDTWMSIIFVCVEIPVMQGQEPCVKPVPVFRVPQFSAKSKETMLFIDSNARVYVGWTDFLRHNELPRCKYCYPKDGMYAADKDGNVLVEFDRSPASKVSKKMLMMLDHASNAVAIGTTAVSVASLFVPVAGPFIAASVWGGISVGMYGAARATGALVDRKKHRQCVCIKNSDARNHWLSLIGNAVGAASTKAVNTVSKLVQSGELIGKTGRLAVNALNVSSLAINGIGVVNSVFVLHNKHKHQELTRLDVFQFSSSVLFFAHAAVTLQTADMIIKNSQNVALQQFEANLKSSEPRKVFSKIVGNTIKDPGMIEGTTKAIRGLMHIDNPDDFFAGLVEGNRFSETSLTETGRLAFSPNSSIHPTALSDRNEDMCQVILHATQSLADGKGPEIQFQSTAVEVSVENKGCNSILQLLGPENAHRIYSNGQRAFVNISSLEKVNILKEMLRYFDSFLHDNLLELSIRLSGLMRWVHKLHDVLKFVCEAVADTALKIENKYQDDLRYARNLHGSSFSQEEFDREYRIEGKRFKYFCNFVLENYIKSPVLISFLLEAFGYWIHSANSLNSASQTNKVGFEVNRQFNSLTANQIYLQNLPGCSSQMDCEIRNHVVPESNGLANTEESRSCIGPESNGQSGSEESQNSTNSESNDQTNFEEPQTLEKPCVIPRKFSVNEKHEFLPPDEVFKIAREVTSLDIDETRCIVQYYGENVTLLLPRGAEVSSVAITRDVENNTITVYVHQ